MAKKKIAPRQQIAGIKYLEEIERLDEKLRPRVWEGVNKLRKQFAKSVPERTLQSTLLLATWNIRAFGSGGKRQLFQECYIYMAAMLKHFDLIAIQEVRDIEPLEKVTALMGPWWKYLVTDVTLGSEGNHERLAFVYDSRKVEFDGLVGEVVLPTTAQYMFRDDLIKTVESTLESRTPKITFPAKELVKLKQLKDDEPTDKTSFKKKFDELFPRPKWTKKTKAKWDAVEALWREVLRVSFVTHVQQFARTPFLSRFKSGWTQFDLCTVHIVFAGGEKQTRRGQEVDQLASILKKRSDKLGTNVVLLGDMNAFQGEAAGPIDALEKNGFTIPEESKGAMSNIRAAKTRQPFDQIGVYQSRGGTLFELTGKGGVFDFFKSVFRIDQVDEYAKELGSPNIDRQKKLAKFKDSKTRLMSDHLIKWVEIQTEYTDLKLDVEKLVNEQQWPNLKFESPSFKPKKVSKPSTKTVEVIFKNERADDVRFCWLNQNGTWESKEEDVLYPAPRRIETTPKTVWKITTLGVDGEDGETLGYFVVGNVSAHAKIPLDKKPRS